jgi:hypothetical protein
MGVVARVGIDTDAEAPFPDNVARWVASELIDARI